MRRRFALLVAGFLALPVMSQTPALQFEAATVKANKSDDRKPARELRGATIYLRNVTMNILLSGAYGVLTSQISGAPGWFDADRFDVVAKAPAGATSSERVIMLQNLLKRSFRLTVHQENRLLPGYALVISRRGPKLEPSEPGQFGCIERNMPMLHVSCRHATADDIANVVMKAGADYLNGGKVINDTGLGGSWNFDLNWVGARFYDAASAPGAPASPEGVAIISLFLALEDQLGLGLEKRRIPTPILVIDHVNRVPVEN